MCRQTDLCWQVGLLAVGLVFPFPGFDPSLPRHPPYGVSGVHSRGRTPFILSLTPTGNLQSTFTYISLFFIFALWEEFLEKSRRYVEIMGNPNRKALRSTRIQTGDLLAVR